MDLAMFERCQEFITTGPMPRMSGGDSRSQICMGTLCHVIPTRVTYSMAAVDLLSLVAKMQPADCLIHHRIRLYMEPDVVPVLHQHQELLHYRGGEGRGGGGVKLQ